MGMTGTVDEPHSGSCHCGGVRFTVALPVPLRGTRCNCSICSLKGSVMVGAPLTALQVIQGENLLTCYRFNTGVAEHWFCSQCGIHCFHKRRSDPDQYGINAACLLGISPYDNFPVLPVSDGVHHANDHGGLQQLAGWLRFEPAHDSTEP